MIHWRALILIEKTFPFSQQWFLSVEITFFKVQGSLILDSWFPPLSSSD